MVEVSTDIRIVVPFLSLPGNLIFSVCMCVSARVEKMGEIVVECVQRDNIGMSLCLKDCNPICSHSLILFANTVLKLFLRQIVWVSEGLSKPADLLHTTTLIFTYRSRLALLHTSTCLVEGERSAHLSSLKSRCDSKFFRPLWDGRSCYSSQDGGQGSGCLMIEEKRSKFILLRALCQVPVAYCWEPLTHHRVTAPEVTSNAINLPHLLKLLPSAGWAQAGREAVAAAAAAAAQSLK